MANPEGFPTTLLHERGNSRAAKHAVYSPRLRAGRARELAQYVEELSPVTTRCDSIACEELGSLLALAECIDNAIEDGGVINPRRGTARSLIDLRLRTDRRIAEWTARLGLDPASRAKIGCPLGVSLFPCAPEQSLSKPHPTAKTTRPGRRILSSGSELVEGQGPQA